MTARWALVLRWGSNVGFVATLLYVVAMVLVYAFFAYAVLLAVMLTAGFLAKLGNLLKALLQQQEKGANA